MFSIQIIGKNLKKTITLKYSIIYKKDVRLDNTNFWVTIVKYTYKKKLDILLYLDLIEVKKKPWHSIWYLEGCQK